MREKTDVELGYKIRDMLIDKGLESPIISSVVEFRPDDDKIKLIETRVREILTFLGVNQSNDSVKDTANRVAKMMVLETMWGMDYRNFPKVMTFGNEMKYNEMCTERCISNSLCSHHLVPILGTVIVSYIPGTKVIGLSKLNRITEFFSRRPQEAERMTEQIAATVKYILETDNVAVLVKGKHLCVSWRGVGDQNAVTMTTHLGGDYKKKTVREEFMASAHQLLQDC